MPTDMHARLMLILMTPVWVGWFASTMLQPGVEETERIELDEIRVSFELPAQWNPNGAMIKTTVGQFKQQTTGAPYEKPDRNDVAAGVIGYTSFSVDSTLLPAAEAYEFHELGIEMYGYYDWYQRWLWSQGKRKLTESAEAYFEERMKDLQGTPKYEWLDVEMLPQGDTRKVIEDAYAFEYAWQPTGTEIPMKGQIYFVVSGNRCYRLRIEGVQQHFEKHIPMYNGILQSMEVGG